MNTFLKWLATALAVAAAAWLVPGIYVDGPNAWIAVGIVAAVLAFLNVFIKPMLSALSCGFIIITFGLFALVINAGLLYFSGWFCQSVLGVGFHVDGFWPAFWGGVIISIVSWLLFSLFGVDRNVA